MLFKNNTGIKKTPRKGDDTGLCGIKKRARLLAPFCQGNYSMSFLFDKLSPVVFPIPVFGLPFVPWKTLNKFESPCCL